MPDLGELISRWGYLAMVPAVLIGNAGLPIPEEAVLGLAGYLVWSVFMEPIREVAGDVPPLAMVAAAICAIAFLGWRARRPPGADAVPEAGR